MIYRAFWYCRPSLLSTGKSCTITVPPPTHTINITPMKPASDDPRKATSIHCCTEGGGSNQVVDAIVAVALAYAEKTHGESDNHGLYVMRGSRTTTMVSSQLKMGGRQPQSKSAGSKTQQLQPSKQKRNKHASGKHMHQASTGAQEDASSSIHSFYTRSNI